MKKDKYYKKGKGLRTFFLYSIIVFLIIFFSICAKAIFVINHSKFDGQNLNLAISENNKIVGIIGFNKSTNKIIFLKIKKTDTKIESVGQSLGIISDAKLNSDRKLINISVVSILTKAAVKSDSINTNLTIFDIVRLILFSKSISSNDTKAIDIDLTSNTFDHDKDIGRLFKNDLIASENLSIQIINATEKSGLGNRLERVLNNLGAQVISVSTARGQQSKSVIQYFENNSYTALKLKKILNFSAEKLKEKSIADVVIIIGEDMKNTSVF